MLRRPFVFAAVAVGLAAAAPARADIVIQPDEPAGKDVLVYQFLPTTNFETSGQGFQELLGSSKTNTGHDLHTLIEFDLSAVELAPEQVESATLYIYVTDGNTIFGGAFDNPSPAHPVSSQAFALAANWVENTVTWNTQPPTTGAAVDTIAIDGFDQWIAYDITPLAQSWLAGSLANHGILLNQVSQVINPSSGLKVASVFESSAATNKPYLEIVAASVTGDFDGDGDVDVQDFAVFFDCYGGPAASPSPTPPTTAEDCRAVFDFDQDTDVDLVDFAELQRDFAG